MSYRSKLWVNEMRKTQGIQWVLNKSVCKNGYVFSFAYKSKSRSDMFLLLRLALFRHQKQNVNILFIFVSIVCKFHCTDMI